MVETSRVTQMNGCHRLYGKDFRSNLFIYLLYLTLVYKIVKNNSTNKYQQNLIKI